MKKIFHILSQKATTLKFFNHLNISQYNQCIQQELFINFPYPHDSINSQCFNNISLSLSLSSLLKSRVYQSDQYITLLLPYGREEILIVCILTLSNRKVEKSDRTSFSNLTIQTSFDSVQTENSLSYHFRWSRESISLKHRALPYREAKQSY